MGEVDRKVLTTYRKVLTESYVLGNGAPSFPASVCAVCIPSTAPWTLKDGHSWRWQGKITRAAKRAVLSTGWAAFVRESGAQVGDAVEFVFLPGNVLHLVRQSREEQQEQQHQQQDLASQRLPQQQPEQQPGQQASLEAASQAQGEHCPRQSAAVLSEMLQVRRRERRQQQPHQQQPRRQQGEQQLSSQPALLASNMAAKRRRLPNASAQATREPAYMGGVCVAQSGLEAGTAPDCDVRVRPHDALSALHCMEGMQRGPRVPDSNAVNAAGGSIGKDSSREGDASRAGEQRSSSVHVEGTSDVTQARVAGGVVVSSRGNAEAVPAVPSVRPAAGSMARARQHLRWRRVTRGQATGVCRAEIKEAC